MAGRDGTLSGQLAGLNSRFQTGMSQVTDFLKTADFNNLIVLAGQKASSVTSTAAVPLVGQRLHRRHRGQGHRPCSIRCRGFHRPTSSRSPSPRAAPIPMWPSICRKCPGRSRSTTSQAYINQQLADAGLSTKFKRVVVATDPPKTTAAGASASTTPVDPLEHRKLRAPARDHGLGEGDACRPLPRSPRSIWPAPQAPPRTATSRAASSSSPILSGGATSEFSKSIAPANGTATAKSTVVDSNGNVYVLGTTTGNFGGLLDKGEQDAYLTKYDSAGNVLWQRMLGAQGSADAGYALRSIPLAAW